MAKTVLQEKLSKIDKLANAINNKAGKNIINRLSNEETKEKLKIKFVPTPSKNINDTIGGGFPRKRTTIVTGKEDSGKTSLLLQSIGYNMSIDPEFVACWLESESSLELNYLIDTFHIDPERFVYLEHEREGAGEAALEKIESILALNVCDMVVINSLKCLVPSAEMERSIAQETIALQARMNAKMARKFTSLVSESNAAFVIVQHLTTDIGSMAHDKSVLAGGGAIRYASALTIDLRKRSLAPTDPITPEEGIKIGLTVKKNHCTPAINPYLKTEYYVVFGEGIEQYLETLENAIEQGILYKGGAYIKDLDPDTGEVRQYNGQDLVWRGKESYRQFMKDNPEYFETLMNRVAGTYIEMTAEEIKEAKLSEKDLVEDNEAETNFTLETTE